MFTPSLSDLIQLSEQRRLPFPKSIEAEFQEYYFENFLWINRIGLVLGLILWSIFGIIDLWAMPISYKQVWIIRFGMGAPVIVMIILASFSDAYRQIMRPLTVMVTLTAGLGIIAMVRLAQPGEVGYYYYIYGLTVILMFLYTVPGPQFANVFWVSLALLLLSPLAYAFRFDFFKTQTSIVVFVVQNSFLITLAIVGCIGNYFYELSIRRNFIQRLIIQKEEDRSSALLLNVLPAPIAERLKRGEDIADFYPSISVLFADIVDFTPLSTRLPPAEVVQLLNKVFSTFDELTEQRTLEKIKTVGDAYMVVSGLPIPRPDHAQALAELALDMQQAIAGLDSQIVFPIQVRIGLHSGPVVAGVIGWRKFAYDLWGDTVNTASRMESHGLPGRIQVCESLYELLRDHYIFEDRGVIEVKGKGKMHTYWLTGKI